MRRYLRHYHNNIHNIHISPDFRFSIPTLQLSIPTLRPRLCLKSIYAPLGLASKIFIRHSFVNELVSSLSNSRTTGVEFSSTSVKVYR